MPDLTERGESPRVDLIPPSRPDRSLVPSRDSVTTIRDDGSRRFLHPTEVTGGFNTARRWSAGGLIILYLLLPWIKVGGYPAVFLDVTLRRFHLFGWTLVTQDLWLMFFLISGVGFSLFLLTSLFGRVWCGWACPQTIFLEQVFRRIDRWVDGDAPRRRALDTAKWSGSKIAKRLLKHSLFFLSAALIAHLFLAYFVSLPELWSMMTTVPAEHLSLFIFVFVITGVLYFNFAWFREQLCIVICPYGRLQSALIDNHSLVIGYDAHRGEPRGKLGAVGAGACVDCTRCIQVCPTGIDIRQGLQIECIGCSACIDACDDVMDRVGRPRGLIRYDSAEGLAGRPTRWLRPRTLVYVGLLALGASVFGVALHSVHSFEFALTRMAGAPYYLDGNLVRNQFLVRVVNKRPQALRFSLQVGAPLTGFIISGLDKPIEVPALGEEVEPVIVEVPRSDFIGPVKLMLRAENEYGEKLQTEAEFLGPDMSQATRGATR